MSAIIPPKSIIVIELDNMAKPPSISYRINQNMAYPEVVAALSQVLIMVTQALANSMHAKPAIPPAMEVPK